MAKTVLTKLCERALWKENSRQGTFGCFEVTIGWYGTEVVDFLTYKTTGDFRCYEIKVSKKDFNSPAKLSFVGDYNYYVMPEELYVQLKRDAKKEVESRSMFTEKEKEGLFDTRLKNQGIGLLLGSPNGTLKQKIGPKRKSVNMGTKSMLLESMVRSLSREVKKFYRNTPYWGDAIPSSEQIELIPKL